MGRLTQCKYASAHLLRVTVDSDAPIDVYARTTLRTTTNEVT